MQVGEHVLDQSLGFAALMLGFAPCIERVARQHAHRYHCGERGRRDGRHALVSAMRVALDQLVEAEPDDAGDELEQAQMLAVPAAAEIG
ncbi:MAG TPA: hypothetical protein VHZ29_13075, partial [Rhizomicrobium sp.]|nr:hypothetical protein [Rhizomicrobium sp.]